MTVLPRPYDGQHLGDRPHVAVIFRDQIGDFLVATPLMRGFRERFPRLVLDYLGGERTRELEAASDLIDARYSLYGRESDLSALRRFLSARRDEAGGYDLAINLELDTRAAEACSLIDARFVAGRVAADSSSEARVVHAGRHVDRLWTDMAWNRSTLLQDFPELTSQFIGEIFCRLARVETDFTKTEAPIVEAPVDTPEVLLSTGANRVAKLWPATHWLAVARWLRESGRAVGLLGAPPGNDTYHVADTDDALIRAGVRDLRGALSLPQVAGALARAAIFLTVDNGLMHLGSAAGARCVALFGASPQRLWAPRGKNVHIVEPTLPCGLCEENRFRNTHCLLPVHQCMTTIEPERVIQEIQTVLAGGCTRP
ncbi:MAG TPA: glycosyltransferase family 9 protein [Chloroflexota bacterium]|nr:glycosyltransferase family 9 protein [Chloroflexota bacterium]